MMASLEFRIISEILRSRSMGEAIRSGLRPTHFRNPDAKSIFKKIETHWRDTSTMKQVPMVESIEREYPAFKMLKRPDDHGIMETLVKQLKEEVYESDIVGLANHFVELAERDPEQAYSDMVNALPVIQAKFRGGGGFGIQEIIDDATGYAEAAAEGRGLGIPWLWDCLTQDTMGKNPGDFHVFYGRGKSMKTWLLLANAVSDYAIYNQRVLLWSREMDEKKLKMRIGALLGQVDYQLLKDGSLPVHKRKQYRDQMKMHSVRFMRAREDIKKAAYRGDPDLLVFCGRDAVKTILEMEGLIRECHPDVVYLDSFYHMDTDRGGKNAQMWAKYQYLAEDIKGMALNEKIPVVGAAQANREGEKTLGANLTEIAGSDAIGREADTLMRVIRGKKIVLDEEDYEGVARARKEAISIFGGIVKGQIRGRNIPRKIAALESLPKRTGRELAVVLPGNREGNLEGFLIRAHPAYDFSVIDPDMSTADVKAWVDRERKAEEEEAKRKESKNKEKHANPQPMASRFGK
jgi:hypothetical protein